MLKACANLQVHTIADNSDGDGPEEPGDQAAIRIDNPFEVRRWCQRLVCTAATLREAVRSVGTDPNAVRAAIKKRGLEVGVRDSTKR